MDVDEATRVVFSRIQSLDPENALKIMGLLLIQEHGEKEMIRLAFGPESLVHSVILKARKELGLTTSPTSTSPTSSTPFSSLSRPNSSSSSSTTATTTITTRATTATTSRLGGFNIPPSLSIPNPSNSSSSSWGSMSDQIPAQDDLISTNTAAATTPNGTSALNPASLPFYANGSRSGCDGFGDLVEEFQLQDQLSFLNDHHPKSPDLFYPQQVLDSLSSTTSTTPSGSDSPMAFPSYWGGSVHRRSCSVSDVLGAEDLNSGFGWRPCHYFARGYCKNGSSCRFVHGGESEATNTNMSAVGSPNGNNNHINSKIEIMEQCHELFRSKSASHQQRLASTAASFPYSPKSINFLLQQQNESPRAAAAAAAAALMMGEDMQKLGRPWFDRNDLISPASRQIYLTFPADSTFREEDVSNYFSMFGPVQDVRIPYQQKRMFGFVTFLYPETVKMILAKGNPHFVCDARVLVKPYKEKGKIPDKFRKQQLDRGDFSPSGTPTGLDSRDPFDLPFGSRMFYNTHDALWRRKLEEQADLQQAIELQSRKLMGLQLLDVTKHHHHRALSSSSPIPSPTHSPNFFNQSTAFPPLHPSAEVPPENCASSIPVASISAPSKNMDTNTTFGQESLGKGIGNGKNNSHVEDHDLLESLEHNLPDSPFTSPTKGSGEYFSAFNNGFNGPEKEVAVPVSSADNNNLVTSADNNNLVTSASLDMASITSFNCQMPRFSSGHGSIGVYAGTGGPTCPVGI